MKSKEFSFFFSVVVVIEEKERLFEFTRKLSNKLKTFQDYEIIIIDNTGSHNTVRTFDDITSENGFPNIQVFKLGKKIERFDARWLGLEFSLGDFIICIDSEVNNFDIIDSMIIEISKGNEIIFSKFNIQRSKNIFRKKALYNLLGKLSMSILGTNLSLFSSDYITVSRRVINHILKYKNPELVFRNIYAIRGLKTTYIEIPENKLDSLNLRKSIIRGIKIIVNSTNIPLRFATMMSSLGALFSFIYSIYVLLMFFLNNNIAPGWASLSLQTSIMFFCISMVLLIMSEYILNTMSIINKRNNYFIVDEFTSTKIERKDRLNVQFKVNKD